MGDALAGFLRDAERRFGGTHTAKRGTVSPFDPRTTEQLARGSMRGGDRFGYPHSYSAFYASEIAAYLGEETMREQLTPELLRSLEQKYSGGKIERGIKWPNVSPDDPRPQSEIDRGGHDGHRMQPREVRGRDYAETYSRELAPLYGERLTLVELGILRGIGLAIWCDLFPRARVIGLDVDTAHFYGNLDELKRRGAFTIERPDGDHRMAFDEAGREPEVYEFDELSPEVPLWLGQILGKKKIHIMIDDALHMDEPILKAFADFLPFMAPRFLYFIEDNRRVWKKLKAEYPHLRVEYFDELTVVSR